MLIDFPYALCLAFWLLMLSFNVVHFSILYGCRLLKQRTLEVAELLVIIISHSNVVHFSILYGCRLLKQPQPWRLLYNESTVVLKRITRKKIVPRFGWYRCVQCVVKIPKSFESESQPGIRQRNPYFCGIDFSSRDIAGFIRKKKLQIWHFCTKMAISQATLA